MIRDCWSRIRWGYHEIDIKSLCNEGWLSYIRFRGQRVSTV
jgi:hypothetical protein